MRGVREPLLWIALASFAAALPHATVGMPACAALALSIQMLMRTRLGTHARGPLRLARLGTALLFLLYAGVLVMEMVHVPRALLYRAADLGMPVALFVLATALSRMAQVAALDESGLWLAGVRVLFAGELIVDVATGGAGIGIRLLAFPTFALLVLQMRAQTALPNVR